ncbi:MAG TPA: AMP-binding protein [bacterium]|nr:AMP-binding protein [bacterium]
MFNPAAETLPAEALQARQLELLRALVARARAGNPLHRARLADIAVSDLRTTDDIVRLPFMDKELFRTSYPVQLALTPAASFVEMHMSSGSTGTPVVMPYTRADLAQWAECMARCFIMAGARPGDPVQITPSFGLFNGGFGFYHGARAAGLFIIPTGAGNTQRQLRLARDFHTRVLTGVVSYGLRCLEVLEETGGRLPDLQIGMFGAETFSEALKEKFRTAFGLEVFDIYGMTETGGVGTLGMDCPAHDGIHLWEDHYLAEIIDPATGNRVPDGTAGELVVTSLTREALPVIRFRTGDCTRIVSRARCACGRTHLRLAPVTGRVDDMLIIKGVNFFPRQVEQALMAIPGVGNNWQIIIEENCGVRDVRVNVEAAPAVTGYLVEKALKEALGFSPKGDVFPLGALPRQEGKAQRVFHRQPDGSLR